MHTKTIFKMFVYTEIIEIIIIMFDLHSVQFGLLSLVFLDFTIHESFSLPSFIEKIHKDSTADIIPMTIHTVTSSTNLENYSQKISILILRN